MADTLIGREDELTARLDVIERRLTAIEWALGWRPAASQSPLSPASPGEVASTTLPPTQLLPAPAPVPDRAPATRPDLESRIGRNWTSWVGAIVLVLGAFFFLQYAWEQGLLRLSPLARVCSAITLGIALGAAGAWTNRRAMRVLAGTLTGAGVAIVMGAFFAAHALFTPPVFSNTVVMAGVCAAAALGIWRAVRINVVSVAVIALLGAYVAPAILNTGRDQSASLIVYLATLGVVAWMLAYLRPRWLALRWFALTCTVVWMAVWIVAYPLRGEHRPLGALSVTFFLAGFLAEAFFTLHRAYRTRDERDESAVPAFVSPLENSLATLSLLATAAAFAGFYAILHRAPAGGATGLFHLDLTAAIALGLAALHVALAQATPSRPFARASLLAAAALVTLAIPLLFGRVAITLAWLVLAVALAALGWRRDNRATRLWCAALLVLSLLRLFTLDLLDPSLRKARWHVADQPVSFWLLLAWALAIFSHVVGRLFVPTDFASPRPLRSATLIAAVGTAVFFTATTMTWTGPPLTFLAIAWVAALVALVALAPRARQLAYFPHTAVAWLIVAFKWLSADGLTPILDHWRHPDTLIPIVNPAALAGVALIILGISLWRQFRPPESSRERQLLAVFLALLAFAWLNFETLRAIDSTAARYADVATAKQVALSVLWGVVGLAAVVAGFARELRPLRYAALGLLGLTLAKILLVDLAQVRPVYRILSFVAVGALLLCVSFVYHRHEDTGTRQDS